MSNGNSNLSGSAARHHEETGGNVQAGTTPVPFGGDAARQAEQFGDSTNEAHGIRTAPRGQYRAARSIEVKSVRGARLVESEPAKPDLSQRTAADYLPPQLKARLIAEGKLPPEPGVTLAPAPAAAPVDRPATETSQPPAEEPASQPQGLLGSLARIFRKLF